MIEYQKKFWCAIIQKLLHLKIVEFYELYYLLIESKNIEIFESINVYGSKKTKRKIKSKVKKNIAFHQFHQTISLLQSETLTIADQRNAMMDDYYS